MNASVRLTIAVLASFLVHAAVLAWAMQHANIRTHHDSGLLQVLLAPYHDGRDRPLLLQPAATVSRGINTLADKQARKPADSADHSPTSVRNPSGHFRWRAPAAYRQDEKLRATQLAQLAHQRQARTFAVMSGMSNLSPQLNRVTTEKIDCVQRANMEIACTPEPDEATRQLLVQLFALALESRELGIGGNPVRLDFGTERGVSVTLLH